MTREEEEDPAVKKADADVSSFEEDEYGYLVQKTLSPAQRRIAREKAKWERIKSRTTLKRSPTRTTRKTLDDQVGYLQVILLAVVVF